jgi:molybdopterin-containing oxidoreductase family membrane subunit
VLFFLIVLKAVPVIELHAIEELRGEGHSHVEGDD